MQLQSSLGILQRAVRLVRRTDRYLRCLIVKDDTCLLYTSDAADEL